MFNSNELIKLNKMKGVVVNSLLLLDRCAASPCFYGGTCTNVNCSYDCACTHLITGSQCEILPS